MNNQEIFDISTRGIISQGGPSYEGGQCMYRSQDGRKCAVGWLISDEDYSRAFEGKIFISIMNKLNFRGNYEENSDYLIEDLQYSHDCRLAPMPTQRQTQTTDWAEWKRYLQTVASRFDLDSSVLEEIPDV